MLALTGLVKRGLALTAFYFVCIIIPCFAIVDTADAQDELACDMTLRGQVTQQSVDLIIEEIQQLRENGNQLYMNFCLDSVGGQVEHARRLVQVLEEDTEPTDGEARVTTVVKADATCLSSCALIFMAGFDCAWGRRCQTSRFMEPSATIGFHSPYIASAYPPETEFPAKFVVIQEAYESALAHLGYFVSLNANPYFVDSAIRYPSILISELLRHNGPHDFYYIERLRDAISLNIELYGKWKYPSEDNPEQIILNACDNANWLNKVVKGFPPSEGSGRDSVWISGVRNGDVLGGTPVNYIEISAMPQGTGAMPVFQWHTCQIPVYNNQLRPDYVFKGNLIGIYSFWKTDNEIVSSSFDFERMPLVDFIDPLDPRRVISQDSGDFDILWEVIKPRVNERDLWLFWSMDSEISEIAVQ